MTADGTGTGSTDTGGTADRADGPGAVVALSRGRTPAAGEAPDRAGSFAEAV